MFIERTDAEAETLILWPPDAKNWLIGKNARKDWRQLEKGETEEEMVEWYHWLNKHEFEQAPGDGDGQGSLACCSPWGRKELETTEWLNWTELREQGSKKVNEPYAFSRESRTKISLVRIRGAPVKALFLSSRLLMIFFPPRLMQNLLSDRDLFIPITPFSIRTPDT